MIDNFISSIFFFNVFIILNKRKIEKENICSDFLINSNINIQMSKNKEVGI